MKLRGKVAVVTGAGAGIGQAIAGRFAAEGAAVVVADVDSDRGAAAAAAIREAGGAVVAVRADVSQAADAESMAALALEQFGRLDILCNNAAVQLHQVDARAHELSEEIWDRTYAINAKGVWLCSKAAIPHMLRGGGGAIVNIASPTGLVGCAPGYTAYSSSKAAVFGLTRVMAADYGAGNIRVNAIVPGTTETPLIAEILSDPATRAGLLAKSLLGRLGTPEDVAGLALFLASDDARYCTGGFYMVDGGLTAV